MIAAAGLGGETVIACLGLTLARPTSTTCARARPWRSWKLLAEHKAGRLLVVEPHARALPRELAGLPVELTTLADALARARVVVLLVNHREFPNPGPAALAGKTVIDTRGAWRK